MSDWTAADQAELDVLMWELTGRFDEHRRKCDACRPEPCPVLAAYLAHKAGCRACQGDAPLTFGPPCSAHKQFVAHGDACKRCNPCPHLKAAIEVVLAWREVRLLLTRAEELRIAEVLLLFDIDLYAMDAAAEAESEA